MIKNLDALKEKAYQNAVKHGWHREEYSEEHWIAMISTEIAEAIQADRNHRHVNDSYFCSIVKSNSLLSDPNFKYLYSSRIANTMEDEIADIVIRILDFAAYKQYHFESYMLTEKEEENIVQLRAGTFVGGLFTEIAYYMLKELMEIGGDDEFYDNVIHLIAVISLCEATAKIYGFDLSAIVKAKMRYNTLRPYKHGFKAY